MNISEIACIQSSTPYAYIYLVDGSKVFCTQPMKYFDSQLANNGFVRVHKSSLINVAAVTLYVPEGNGLVKLVNGQQIGFARGKKRAFLEVVGEMYL